MPVFYFPIFFHCFPSLVISSVTRFDACVIPPGAFLLSFWVTFPLIFPLMCSVNAKEMASKGLDNISASVFADFQFVLRFYSSDYAGFTPKGRPIYSIFACWSKDLWLSVRDGTLAYVIHFEPFAVVVGQVVYFASAIVSQKGLLYHTKEDLSSLLLIR